MKVRGADGEIDSITLSKSGEYYYMAFNGIKCRAKALHPAARWEFVEANYDDHFSIPARYTTNGTEHVGGVRIEENGRTYEGCNYRTFNGVTYCEPATFKEYELIFDELTFDTGKTLTKQSQGANRHDVDTRTMTHNATLMNTGGTTFNMTTMSNGKSYIVLTGGSSDANQRDQFRIQEIESVR